jgi:hypothetical protein
VIFTAKAKKSSLKVYDSSDKEYVTKPLGNDTEIVVIDNPSAGTWTVHSKDGFSYSFRKGTSIVTYGYGFSLEIPKSKEETSEKPIKGQSNSPLTMPINIPMISGSENVLSVFVSNPQYDGTLRMIHFRQEGQGRKLRFFPLTKIRNDLYVTNPVSLDGPPSKVRLFGTDSQNENIIENISPVSTDTRKIRFHCWF